MMKQTRQVPCWLIGFLCLGILLSACQVRVETPTTLATEATATFTASPTPVPPPETPTPTTPSATPTLSFAVPPPPFLYIYENKLLERTGGEAPRLLAELPDAGAALDTMRIDDVVLVLQEQGLQRVRLADGSTDLLRRFDVPALFGALMVDGAWVTYQVGVDDPKAEFSLGTGIGLYDMGVFQMG